MLKGNVKLKNTKILSWVLCMALLVTSMVFVTPTQAAINYSTSWIGNTYGGADYKWVQNYIDSMVVETDGTCRTESSWDEAGRTHGVYKDGDVLVSKDNDKWDIDSKSAGGWTISGNTITGNGKTITGVEKPTAIAMGRGKYNGLLLVADNGSKKQILFYDVSGTPYVKHRFGAEGGIGASFTSTYDLPAAKNAPAYPAKTYAAGVYHPFKLWGMTGIGMDNNGRLFVATSEMGTMIRCFKEVNNQWILDWQLMGLCFVDNVFYDESTDSVDVYGVQEHYKMDFSKTTPGSEWSLYGYTLDAYAYPEDPRGVEDVKAGHEHGLCSAVMRNINGHRILYTVGMTNQMYNIFRFKEGTDIAVPAGLIMERDHRIYDLSLDYWWPANRPSIASGTVIWRDSNGDGKYQANEYTTTNYSYNYCFWVDKSGNFWQGGNPIVCRKLAGFDSQGNPIYDDAHTESYSISGMGAATQIIYQEDYDRMILTEGGFGRDLKGAKVFIVDNWSKGNRSARYVCGLSAPNPSSISVAGDYLFDCGWETQTKVWITDLRNGHSVGTMEGGPEIDGVNNTGWVDIGYGLQSYKRSNGEIVVFVEDDYRAKVIMYRWRPDGTSTPTPTPTATPTPTPTPGGTTRYEAENGTLNGCEVWNESTASGGAEVAYFDATGDSAQITVNASKAGTYNLYIGYGCDANSQVSIYVNGTHKADKQLPSTGAWNNYQKSTAVSVSLNAGNNTIRLQLDSSDYGYPELDYVDLQ